MLEPVETTTQKRKASPSPSVEDVTLPKRAKLEDGAGSDAVANKPNGTGQGSPGGVDQSVPGRSLTQEKQEGPSTIPEGASAPKPVVTTDADAPLRRSPQVRRPSVSSGPVPASAPGGRRNISQEERKRGLRLFGGLKNTLSQTVSNTQQKKRLEIERRQQEKARQQRAEDDRRRTKKLAKLIDVRKVEQLKFDEQVMRARHSNMLAAAHSLRTSSEPRLRYRPWEPTKEQENTIKNQIRVTEETIDKERQDFKRSKERALKELGVRPPAKSESTVGEPNPPEDANRPSKGSHDKDHDENGDEMVQDKEDTVLY
ncbi:pinin/SDK/memA/ protein conserved region-domain-containing protein [Podospora appendiculata]|uniref:Pinin/SDK/memA/ protein conserved region-domain-containing protein n=1 Tax=Podospora appendiculata TaxID=314037 RepID=A0AAE1CFY5_9PEZI|nr:pinin/SDK/memA/ protein conserved region-domain-containing protein [Podospora appendiculata]